MTDSSPFTLRTPRNEREWDAYHAIRRKVLFENRGLFGVYDGNRPDDHLDGTTHMLFLHDDEAVGVIRIDISPTEAIFRRVAIRDDCQGRGYGRAMLSLAEAFALGHGCQLIRSFVNPEAQGFYERCGFTRDWAVRTDVNHIPMRKTIRHSNP